MSLQHGFQSYDLHFKHPFTVSSFSRTETPIVIQKISFDGIDGYGESTMPPYLGESQESVQKFLRKIELHRFYDPANLSEILSYIDSIDSGNNAAKAGFDIALHDLICKYRGQTLAEFYGLQIAHPLTSYTIGIDTPDIMREKAIEAINNGFKVLKIKLGTTHDQNIMQNILEVWQGPFSVDANQGWQNAEETLDFVHSLKEMGALFIEQPFAREDLKKSRWLTENSPLPIVADESIKRLNDLDTIADCFQGINIKLMKSTGLHEAFKLIQEAKKRGLKIVLGCMAESSLAVSAMANFSSLADWVDLDGPFLIDNDPFEGIRLINGELLSSTEPGVGAKPKKELFPF
jgi:L-alanine-DL-glutamate epimerase-like enolase superfamily enzyme